MVGTGTLSPELIQAHCEVRPIEKVLIWEHTPGNGQKVVDKLSGMKQSFEIVSDIESAIPKADIISVATMSSDPLIKGSWLKAGQHLDLVGAYRTDMREADNETLKRSDLYIDHEDAWHETGDLVIPLESGHLTKEDSQGTLFELCGNLKPGRNDEDQITCFKSTGHAMEDLASPLESGHVTEEDSKGTLFELCGNLKPGRNDEQQITCFKSAGHTMEDLASALHLYHKLKE